MSPTPPIGARRRRRTLIAFASTTLALVAAACGGASPQTASTVALVGPPPLPLQGCTYVLNGSVPAGEPAGIQTSFPPFAPSQAATAALEHIKAKGGTGLIYGFTLPSGTSLYAGPDTGGSAAATIASGDSLLTFDPVLWTDASGGQWLAFFVACGGQNLYWVGVDQLLHRNSQFGASVQSTITQLKEAPPFDKTGKASVLPLAIDKYRHLVWTDPKVTTPPARGELLGF